MPRLRLLVLVPIASAMLFVAVHLIVSQGDIARVRFAFSFGFLLGMLVVPEIDREAFVMPWILQVPAGFLAGTLFMAYLSTDGWYWILGGVLGALVGWQARRWTMFLMR